jgi:hypothetical protein
MRLVHLCPDVETEILIRWSLVGYFVQAALKAGQLQAAQTWQLMRDLLTSLPNYIPEPVTSPPTSLQSSQAHATRAPVYRHRRPGPHTPPAVSSSTQLRSSSRVPNATSFGSASYDRRKRNEEMFARRVSSRSPAPWASASRSTSRAYSDGDDRSRSRTASHGGEQYRGAGGPSGSEDESDDDGYEEEHHSRYLGARAFSSPLSQVVTSSRSPEETYQWSALPFPKDVQEESGSSGSSVGGKHELPRISSPTHSAMLSSSGDEGEFVREFEREIEMEGFDADDNQTSGADSPFLRNKELDVPDSHTQASGSGQPSKSLALALHNQGHHRPLTKQDSHSSIRTAVPTTRKRKDSNGTEIQAPAQLARRPPPYTAISIPGRGFGGRTNAMRKEDLIRQHHRHGGRSHIQALRRERDRAISAKNTREKNIRKAEARLRLLGWEAVRDTVEYYMERVRSFPDSTFFFFFSLAKAKIDDAN